MPSCRGELFLKKDDLYAIAEHCRHEDVYTTANSNGTLIKPWDVDRLPSSGLNCIVLSVDSDQPDVHNRIRGVEGTFDRVVSVIEDLVTARDNCREDFTVLTSTILGAHNLDRVEQMVDFFENLGVDTTLFQPIQPTFASDKCKNWWRDHELFPENMNRVGTAVETFIELKRQDRKIFQTEQQFRDIGHYFRHPNELRPGQCVSMNQHMMIDLFGDVRLCFNADRLGLEPVGNVQERGLRAIWDDAKTEQVRRQMRTCRDGCGTMLCHARE